MIHLKYNVSKKLLEKEYCKALFSTKFKDGKTVQEKFKELKESYPCNVIFCDLSFEDIVFVSPENLQCCVNKIEPRIIEQSRICYKQVGDRRKFIYEVKEELKKVFKYEGKFQEPISEFFEINLQTKTCYFCNIHFVNEYKVSECKYKNEFTLDHYVDKGKHPYLALSLYNLIPSCYTCNSKLKKTEKLEIEPPNGKLFDFDDKVKFKLCLDSSCKNLHVKEVHDIDIELKEYFSDKYDKYIEIFKLNERYKAHKDIVFNMIQKAELYPESRLRELQDLTGIPFQQIKKDIFNIMDESEDLAKKPFSKLTKDILGQLDIV